MTGVYTLLLVFLNPLHAQAAVAEPGDTPRLTWSAWRRIGDSKS